jgi:hypothetical protein
MDDGAQLEMTFLKVRRWDSAANPSGKILIAALQTAATSADKVRKSSHDNAKE